MFTALPLTKTINVAFYLVPEFSMIGFSALVDPLRQANYVSGETLYRWQVVSEKGEAVVASNGMSLIADCGIDQEKKTRYADYLCWFWPRKRSI